MRTTLDIDEALLSEVLDLTGEVHKGKAVNLALAEYVRQQRLHELLTLPGRVDVVDNLKELEELEIRELAQAQW